MVPCPGGKRRNNDREAIYVKDFNPADETRRLARLLRDQLNEMLAASQALIPALAGKERALEYVAVLERGMCRQLRLIRRLELEQLLNSPDEVRVTPEPVDLVQLCRALMSRTDDLVRSLDIRARFSTALTTLPTLADRAALEEMLLALISNSVKAIGQGGDICLELGQQERKAVFTITDNGGGMDPAALAAFFDPPEDEDEDEEDDLVPSGRGLWLAQQIAALHGGILIVDSKQSKGVRLAVSIPIISRGGGVLASPALTADDAGGWDRATVALSDCLPVKAFLPGTADR